MVIDRLREQVERQIGKPVTLRGIQSPELEFRGRITDRPGYILLEYRDEPAGYFWHYDTIRRLLTLAAEGQRNVTLYEGDIVFPDISVNQDSE